MCAPSLAEILFLRITLGVVCGLTGLLSNPRIRRRLDAITGTVLVALGVRTALEP